MLETLTGIGPKTKQALSHLGIYTLEDFIEYYPYRYELVRRTNMEEAKEDDSVIIDGTVTNIPPKSVMYDTRISTGKTKI